MRDKTYIASVTRFGEETDVKALIPDALARRRMSRLIKMGVATGMEALAQAGIKTPDAIVTATGYGFLTDSEKLLRAILTDGETSLSPTPFMQSTFNTIGSHLAIMTGCKGYNMTYTHRFDSVGAALTDALMLLAEGKQNVLLVAADELTPTLADILRRMGEERRGVKPSEGATAFVLQREKTQDALATISEWGLEPDRQEPDAANRAYPTVAAEMLANDILAGRDTTFRNGNLRMDVTCRG